MTQDEARPEGSQADRFEAALLDDDPVELYEGAPCAYLSLSPAGTIIKANRTFLNWTGHRREDLIGRKRFQDVTAPGTRIYYETHVAPMLRMQGAVREVAADLVVRSGDHLPVFLNGVAKLGPNGELEAIRLALFDARERRAYEHQLVAERRRAEEAERRARQLAETLQASFLPPQVLEVPGLDIAGAYRPAGDGSEVGGDFYDVFETGRGSWGVVLGDVCGKGAAAAVLTALVRYSVRAEAVRTPYPSAVLAGVHDAIRRNGTEQFCTAAYLVLDRFEGSFRLAMASGGHHLPLLMRDGDVQPLGTTGTILGMIDEVQLSDATYVLRPGDTIVLYTDGVTEARRHGTFLEDEGLHALLLEQEDADAASLADRLVRAVVDYQQGSPRDDVALVVIRVPGGPGPASGAASL